MDAAQSRKRVKGEVVAFGKLFAALTTLKRRDRISEFDVQVYEDRTAHVPLAILSRAVTRIVDSSTWFPTVSELLEACEAVRCELRAALAFSACAECEQSPGYRPIGKMAVERCPCWHVHQAKIAALGVTEKPLALPAARAFTQVGDE
jgi:hypothetical protein